MKNTTTGNMLPNGAMVITLKVIDEVVIYLATIEGVMPFITWSAQNGKPETTGQGHYFPTIDEALADFNQRT